MGRSVRRNGCPQSAHGRADASPRGRRVLATSTLVRRSVLLVPLRDDAAVSTAWRHAADALALDLTDADRTQLPEAIATARRGGAEVFVRVDKAVAYAD